MQELKGTVVNIIYRNVENGYSVIEVDCGGTLEVAVGIFPPISEGERLLMTGEAKFDSRFGEQFAVDTVKVSPPQELENIVMYLSGGLFKGVGVVTATAIVEKFGADTLDVIENEPYRLASVKGISAAKANDIAEAYRQNREMQDAIIFLQKYELTINLCLKIFKFYQANTVFVVKTNPYKLVEDVDGVGFFTADKIAEKMGVERDSGFRIRAGIVHTLKENANMRGNTCVRVEDLEKEVCKLLGFGDEILPVLNECVKNMITFGDLDYIERDDEAFYMLPLFYNLESSIAARLTGLIREVEQELFDPDEHINEYEKAHGITLHELQRSACINAMTNGCCIITGGPGTGKTTIIKCITDILKNRNTTYAMCAPTGRAAKRMSEATGEDAKTIHRLLEFFNDGKTLRPKYNDSNKLDVELIIMDEVSMCDEIIFNALLRAMRTGARLVLLGDVDQLPSVGAGNVLHDLIASGMVPVTYLTHIYRQDADSLIVVNAHRINGGQMPIIDNSKKDFFFVERSNAGDIVNAVKGLVTTRLPSYYGFDPKSVQVLAPMKKGIAGVFNLNSELQQALNPSEGKTELTIGGNTFRIGDKVIHTINNYQMIWERTGEDEQGRRTTESGIGIFNGDIGYVIDIDKKSVTMTVCFDDGRVAVYGQDSMDQLQLAYAISVHKSQGSEFDCVVLALMGGSYMIMTRNLLYTAVTRAKKTIVIVGDQATIGKMVKNTFSRKTYTMLEYFLLQKKDGMA